MRRVALDHTAVLVADPDVTKGFVLAVQAIWVCQAAVRRWRNWHLRKIEGHGTHLKHLPQVQKTEGHGNAPQAPAAS